MLIPLIDVMDGKIVHIEHGHVSSISFDEFHPWLKKFEKYPLIQLVDMDAAMGKGSNHALMQRLIDRLPCQVGGGLRTVEMAKEVIAAGARRAIIGSALFEEKEVNVGYAQRAAREIGADKLVFAVDAKAGRVAVKGWKVSTAITAVDAMQQLEPFCNAFLYTHVDAEGMLVGFPKDVARELRAATKKQLILSGGIRSLDEVADFDAMECDAVVGLAIYKGLVAV